jgi:hypothetical protein
MENTPSFKKYSYKILEASSDEISPLFYSCSFNMPNRNIVMFIESIHLDKRLVHHSLIYFSYFPSFFLSRKMMDNPQLIVPLPTTKDFSNPTKIVVNFSRNFFNV